MFFVAQRKVVQEVKSDAVISGSASHCGVVAQCNALLGDSSLGRAFQMFLVLIQTRVRAV